MSEALSYPKQIGLEKKPAAPNPWDAVMGARFKEAVQSEDKAVKEHEPKVLAKTHEYQTLAQELCSDDKGILTSTDIRIAQNSYAEKRDPAIGEAYTALTESQAELIDAVDKQDATPERAAGIEYVKTVNPINYEFAVSHEVVAVSSILRNLYEISQRKFNRESAFEKAVGWIYDFCDSRDEKKKLERFGYNPDGPQTAIFSLILQEAKAIDYGVPTKDSKIEVVLGRKRVCDCMELQALLADGKKGSIRRRALADAGFRKIPESWKDGEFSTSDIDQMNKIVKKAA